MSRETTDTASETTKWHWIVCFAVPFATILEAALPHSFGSFIAYFQTSTYLHLSVLTWLTATTSAIPCILLPLFVLLIRRHPRYHRHLGVLSFITMSFSCFLSSAMQKVEFLFITYTIIYGLSSALLLAVCIVILSEYFPVVHRHHILASSLYQIGYPVAASAFSPFMAYLISKIGWHHALQILGGIQLVFGCGVALLFKPLETKDTDSQVHHLEGTSKKERSEGDDDRENRKEDESLMDKLQENTLVCCAREDLRRRPQMYSWFFAKLLNYICWFSMRTNLTPFLHWRGYRLTKSAFIMTTYAIGEISLCILAAFVSPFLRGKLLIVHAVGASGMAILMLTWSSLPAVYGLELLVAVLIGVFVQITLTFGYPASAEVLGLDMSVSWTVTNVFAGIGILLSPVLGGVTFDATSTFHIFFYAAGGAWLLQVILHGVTGVILLYFNKGRSVYEEIK